MSSITALPLIAATLKAYQASKFDSGSDAVGKFLKSLHADGFHIAPIDGPSKPTPVETFARPSPDAMRVTGSGRAVVVNEVA